MFFYLCYDMVGGYYGVKNYCFYEGLPVDSMTPKPDYFLSLHIFTSFLSLILHPTATSFHSSTSSSDNSTNLSYVFIPFSFSFSYRVSSLPYCKVAFSLASGCLDMLTLTVWESSLFWVWLRLKGLEALWREVAVLFISF